MSTCGVEHKIANKYRHAGCGDVAGSVGNHAATLSNVEDNRLLTRLSTGLQFLDRERDPTTGAQGRVYIFRRGHVILD